MGMKEIVDGLALCQANINCLNKKVGFGEGAIETTLISQKQSRLCISLEKRPIPNREPGDNSDLRMTNGQYAVVFYNKYEHKYKKGFPFVIRSDLLGYPLRVSGPEMFKEMAKTIPEVKWLWENTSFDPCLFQVAVNHNGIGIPFSFMPSKYGLDEFLISGMRSKNFAELESDGILRGKDYYSKEMYNITHMRNVEKEMTTDFESEV